jgi:hypothetical protein
MIPYHRGVVIEWDSQRGRGLLQRAADDRRVAVDSLTFSGFPVSPHVGLECEFAFMEMPGGTWRAIDVRPLAC